MEMLDKYTLHFHWSDEDEAFLVSCLEFPSVMTHGETREEAISEIRDILSFIIEDLKDTGKKVPIPVKERKFKGNISLRLPPETHEELVCIAAKQDLSLNQCITTIIEKNLYTNSINQSIADLNKTVGKLRSELSAMKQFNEELMLHFLQQRN